MRRWMIRAAAGVLAVAGLTGLWQAMPGLQAQTAVAGAVDESLFAGLRWRSIGPNRGGRSIGAAGSDARPLEYYFTATGGGIFKTTDGGTTWTPAADKFLKTSSASAIAVAQSNPDVVYVGTGETQLRGNIIQGDGVYRTTDGGKTWEHLGLEKTLAIARVRIHPSNPDIVWVAALGDPYASTPDRGIYRTTNGGKTWEQVLFRDQKTGAVDLALDPRNPDVLYAGLWEVFRTPYSLSSGGPGGGLFKSTDGGRTWTELTKNPGLPAGLWGKIGVSVSGAEGARVYTIIENAEAGGVYVSDDGGANWTKVNGDRSLRQRAFYYTRVFADPKDKDTVYVVNTGFYRSTDGGKTYTAIRVPHGDNHDLWISTADPQRMIEANDGGANVSVNGGRSWTDQDYPTAQFYNVFTTRHVPYHVCGAQQDNSTACVSSAGGSDVLYAVGGGESGYIAPDPKDLDVFYAGSYGGLITRFDRRSGQSRQINVWPENIMGHSARDMKERFQWTFPIVFHPLDPNVLFIGSQHLWKTTNGGQSWQQISGDLTRNDPATTGPSGGPITLDQTGVETYATIFTIAPSHQEKDTIWTGSDDGLAHITRDGGKNWANVTPRDLPAPSRISLIEASPHRAGSAYLVANRYQSGDRGPYVYRTADYGASWVKIVTGIPSNDFPRVIREDIKRPGLLYLGTEHGIYVSFDDGAHWQSLRLDLPVTPVHGIVVEAHDLVIGTHGRSFYVLAGIDVLRQLAPEVTSAPLHLFRPAGLERTRSAPIATTWRSSGGGAPGGMAIDYYLAKDAGKVTVEILDAGGQVVRAFTGLPEEKKDAEARPAGGDEEEFFGPPRPPSVGVKKGMNRLVWDGRYAGATTFPGLIMWAGNVAGPLAAPGDYQVRVTVDGETRTQPFAVVRDAQLAGVTDADLRAQFDLARRVNEKLSLANQTVIRIRDLKAQVKDRVGKAVRDPKKDARYASAADSLTGALTAIEGEIYQWRNQSNQDPLNFPIRLNNKLAALKGTIESADARPTDQSVEVFEMLSSRLDAEIAKLDAVVKTDVAAFNRLTAGRKVAPVLDAAAPARPGA